MQGVLQKSVAPAQYLYWSSGDAIGVVECLTIEVREGRGLEVKFRCLSAHGDGRSALMWLVPAATPWATLVANDPSKVQWPNGTILREWKRGVEVSR